MQRVNQAEYEFILNPTEDRRLAWQEAHKIYRSLSLTKAENTDFFSVKNIMNWESR